MSLNALTGSVFVRNWNLAHGTMESWKTFVSCVTRVVERDIFELNTLVEPPSEEAKVKVY